jgi:acyl carrier protein
MASGSANDFAAWLHAWFAERADVPPLRESLETNYFEAHWIDSLSVIELIEAAESRFDVRFTEASFQDRRFQSIGGLAAILAELSDRGAR